MKSHPLRFRHTPIPFTKKPAAQQMSTTINRISQPPMFTHYPLPLLPLPSSFDAEMARIRTIIETMKRKQPARRACSAPSSANPTTTLESVASGKKRARSVVPLEYPRASKRLRGIPADTQEEQGESRSARRGYVETVVPVVFETKRKRVFGRTSSHSTATTVPDEEDRTLDSPLTATFPTAADESSFPPSGSCAESVSSAPSSTFSSQSSTASSQSSVNTSPSSELAKSAPEQLNSVLHFPPRVNIDGRPSLRVKFRNNLLYHQISSPILEWKSNHFLAHIHSFPLRLSLHQSLHNDGYILLPNSLFADISPEDESIVKDIMTLFFGKYALPNQPLPTFQDFLRPGTQILEPSRLIYWTQLSTYFGIPHYLDSMFHSSPGQWHTLFHYLPTFSGLIEFSEIVDNLGFKRARETVHQELARRIKVLKVKRGRGIQVLLKLFKMGYAEMRREAIKWAGKESGERLLWEDCPGCRVQPAFVGDTLGRGD